MVEKVRIDGLKALRRDLMKLDTRLQRNVLNRSVNAGARLIRDEARRNAPVDTGKLKRNIITAKRRAPKGAANYVVTVRQKGKADDSKNAFYARFIEWGTSKLPRRPFLTPAFEAKKHESVAAIKKALAEGIEKEARKTRVSL